ncbi:MAG: hypothetical protein ACMUJM_25500 [bacterium]
MRKALTKNRRASLLKSEACVIGLRYRSRGYANTGSVLCEDPIVSMQWPRRLLAGCVLLQMVS